MKPLLLTTCVLALFASSPPARATILLFDQTRDAATHSQVLPTGSGSSLEPDYGDRVSGLLQAVPGGQFTYGDGGEGFTPNVMVDITSGASMALWQLDYGDLVNVAFGLQGATRLQVDLRADPGFEVVLHGFDLAGWPNADYTIGALRVLDGTSPLFTTGSVLVEGNATGPRHTAVTFAQALHGNSLRIEIDIGNLPAGQQDNIGIDNIRFGQTPPGVVPVPEPPGAAMLALGLAAIGWLARRRRP